MSLFDAINVAATSLDAQSIRLNTISSNLANANTISSTEDGVYRAQHPVFEAIYNEMTGDGMSAGVRVSQVVHSEAEARREYMPHHPMANDEGMVYRPAINSVEEIANMMEASRSYQDNIEAMNMAKQLILRTLTLGRS